MNALFCLYIFFSILVHSLLHLHLTSPLSECSVGKIVQGDDCGLINTDLTDVRAPSY